MAIFSLKVKAELSGVQNLEPKDVPTNPFEYTFHIECCNCREKHGKPVTINIYERHEISGSKGEASFVFRCKGCKSEHSAQIVATGKKLSPENNGEWVRLLEIDSRGVEFTEFVPTGWWQAIGLNSRSKFCEIDLEEGEWYDYDEDRQEEVSITDIEWAIAR